MATLRRANAETGPGPARHARDAHARAWRL